MVRGLGERLRRRRGWFLHDFESGIVSIGTDFDRWTQSGGFQSFVSYVQSEIPAVDTLFRGLFSTVEGIVKGITPLGTEMVAIAGPVLEFVGDLLKISPAADSAAAAIGLLVLAESKWSVVSGSVGLLTSGFTRAASILGSDVPVAAEAATAGLAGPVRQRPGPLRRSPSR